MCGEISIGWRWRYCRLHLRRREQLYSPQIQHQQRTRRNSPPSQAWWNNGLIGITYWAGIMGFSWSMHDSVTPKPTLVWVTTQGRCISGAPCLKSGSFGGLFSRNPYYLQDVGVGVFNFVIFKNSLNLGSFVDFLGLKSLPPGGSRLIGRKWVHNRKLWLQSCAR